MMFGKTLKVELVPKEKIHPDLFKGCERMHYYNSKLLTKNKRVELRLKNAPTFTTDMYHESLQRLLAREDVLRQKLMENEIDYEFPGIVCAFLFV